MLREIDVLDQFEILKLELLMRQEDPMISDHDKTKRCVAVNNNNNNNFILTPDSEVKLRSVVFTITIT